MGLMDGISRGISAAGYGAGEVLGRGVLMDWQAKIQAERDARLAELNEGAAVRAEQRGIQNRATERGMIVDETVANTPRLTKAKVEGQTAEKEAELDFFDANRDRVLSKKGAEAEAGRDKSADKLRSLQTRLAQIEVGYKEQEAKLPPAVKARAESVRDEIKTISTSISKAQADGLFDPTSENGKSLLDRYGNLTSRLDSLLSPYYGDKWPKPADEPAKPSKGIASTAHILNYAKRAGISPQQALEEARRSGYDVTGVQLPKSREAGGLIQQ